MNFTIDKNVIEYEELDEIILINMNQNNFYSLDYIGSLMWKKLRELKDVSKVAEFISREFNENHMEIEKDIIDFIKELKKVGVITLHE
ncbi:PqqD family protein [Paenibacillus sp. SC116]|uniref:PqqD family protein n=1 Tax=Paenibacillus sp. SC116 TaxID=2968986 RepID=UPI00215A8301|nr:PqqD family protein [Paenibacillus sp. SC116]MCR8845067.1 PqqD family protein [Paenibacillus sp. SC116]